MCFDKQEIVFSVLAGVGRRVDGIPTATCSSVFSWLHHRSGEHNFVMGEDPAAAMLLSYVGDRASSLHRHAVQ